MSSIDRIPARALRALAPGLVLGACLWSAAAGIAEATCSQAAQAQYTACRLEAGDDYYTTRAVCANMPTRGEQSDCESEALRDYVDALRECAFQFLARRQLCKKVGEQPHHPDLDPDDFETDFTDLENQNPWFPLTVGHRWEYEGGDETVVVEVLPKTKLIEGITCVVVNDRVSEEGTLIEDTDDWIAQEMDGDVHYCGELARDYETFDGDDPMEPELVEIDGSFKAGRDGAKSGTLFLGAPQVGMTYRQEWSPGDAEDAATVLSTTYGYGMDAQLDEFVPQELAELLCQSDCVVTMDFTPLEPGHAERKYYAPGIGPFLEVDPDSGDVVQLVGCNFDPRCEMLPEP